ncbi:MAG: hypothetical protein QOD69_2751, partial [Solirubrobacteraceae bacterium]|nr:hypothetical protein [Solirubrobacteraceae bacterium]
MTTVSTAATEVHVPTSPYKGLVPYAEEDAPFFFGRDEWRDIIIDNLRAFRLTLLYGQSGIGKSSVLHAGVLHDLRARAQRTKQATGSPGLAVAVFRTWRVDPLGGLVRSLREAATDAVGAPPPGQEGGDTDLAATIATCAEHVGGKLFVILDQFEEYFLYHPEEADGGPFAEAFAEAVNRRDLRVSFLISIREDAVAKLDRFKGRLPSLFDNYLRIDQLSRDEGREAIEKPLDEYARLTGRRITIAPRLVGAVIDDVLSGALVVARAGSGVVASTAPEDQGSIETPYLQLVMTRLWDEEIAAGSQALRLETFENLGRAEGIVRTHLDTAMGALSTQEQDTAAQLFNYLVTPSGSKIAQSATDLATYAELPEPAVKAILERLAGEVRILRPVGADSYEIYHDALAAPILDWRGRWQAEQRRRKEGRRARLYGFVALVSVGVAAAMIVLGVVALNAKNAADRSEGKVKQAGSADLADSSRLRLHANPEQATQFALRAYDTAHTPKAVAAVRAAVSQPALTAVLSSGGKGGVHGASFSPEGRVVATTRADGVTSVWDAATGRSLAALRGRSLARIDGYDVLMPAAFSPDGHTIATAGGDGATRIWSRKSWRSIRILPAGHGTVYSAAFSPDGKWLLTTGADGTATVRNVSTWRTVHVLRARKRGPVRSAAFSPDGKQIAVAEPDSSVSLWSGASGRRLARLSDPRKRPRAVLFVTKVGVAFSPNGRLLLAVGDDGWARLWEVAGRRRIITVHDTSGGAINAAAFSADGRRFVTAGDDGTAAFREVSGRRKPLAELRLNGQVTAAAFSPDGRHLAAGDDGGAISVWDTARHPRLVASLTARSQEKLISSVVFSPDGQRILTAGNDGNARLWDTGAGRPPVALGSHSGGGFPQFSPDGTQLVTSGSDGGVRVWRTDSGRAVAVLHRSGSTHAFGEGFSADGGRFLAARAGRLSVWDARTWQRLVTFRAAGSSANFVAELSPDGGSIATWGFGSRSIQLWNATTGGRVGVLRPPPGEIDFPRFSADAKLVFTTGVDGPAKFWRVSDLRQVPFPVKGVGIQRSPAYSPDGRLLAAVGRDGRVRVWRTSSGERVATVGRRADGGPTFSPDGRRVAIRRDPFLEIWDVTNEKRLSIVRGAFGAD